MRGYKFLAALRRATHGKDGVAFGVVIGYSEGLSVGLETEGSALNEIISSFAFARKNDFQRIRRYVFRCIFWGTGAVKKESDGRADTVGVLREHMDECLSSACRMPWLASGKVSPGVQEAVAVY